MKHITFKDEQIIAVSGSDKGLKTIQKYNLDSIEHDYYRQERYKYFNEKLHLIKDNMIIENRKRFSEKEIHLLESFTYKDEPYSLMFKALFSKITINYQQ